MLSTSFPGFFQIPFANAAGAGYIRSIPQASQVGITAGAASLTDGFPPLNFVDPQTAGGIPPSGADMNGILYQISANIRWQQAGNFPMYNAAFATGIGGYPKGAVLMNITSTGMWSNTVESNTSNPDAGGAGWVAVGASSVLWTGVTGKPTTISGYGITDVNTYAPTLTGVGSSGTWPISVTGSALLNVLITDLTNVTSATVGSGIPGFMPTLAYPIATIGQAVQDGLVNAMWFLTAAQRSQVQTNGTALDLTAALNAAKTWAGNRPLYLPSGTWSITSLSGVGWLGGIVGDGIGNTIIKVRSAVTTAIDFGETVDVNPSAFVLKGFTLDGGNLATTGINVRFRHQYLMESIYVINCTNGIVEKDTYLSRHHNVRTRMCSIGWTLVGSNHSSTFVGCTIDGCSVTHLLVQTNGTALDGNNALAFVGCDIESGTGTAVGSDITCSDISFTGCYIGENMPGAVLIMRGGLCTISGGTLFFGNTVNSFGVNPVGGKVVLRGTQLNGQTNSSTVYLVGTGTGGKVGFYDVQMNGTVGGNQVLAGDVLDYGPQGNVFAKRLGKAFQGNVSATTISSIVTGNSRKIVCLTAPGPSPLITQSVALVNPADWRDGELMYLVIVYEASKPLTAQISGTPLGGAPTAAIGTLPATTGTAVTYVKLDFAAVSGGSFGVLDLIMSAAAVNDYITIYECFFSDSRMLNKGAGSFGNLYKC